MTRAEFFVLRGRGHWAKCRKEFRCELERNGLRCVYRIRPGEAYLKTDIPMYPQADPKDRDAHIMRRYCACCADQQLQPADAA